MARGVLALAFLLIFTSCGTGQAPREGGGGAAAPQIVGDGILTVCTDPSFPPMEFYETPGAESPVGFDMDLAAQLAEMWRSDLRVLPTKFTGLLPALSAGRCDLVISGIFITPERLESFSAIPYLKSSRVLLVREGNPSNIHHPDDLSGKTVATQQGTLYVDDLKEINKDLESRGFAPMTIQQYPDQSDAVQQLLVGRADAVMSNDTEAAFRELESPEDFEVAYVFPGGDTYGIYFRPNDKDTADFLKEALRTLHDRGVLQELAARWKLPEAGLVTE